MSIAAHQQRAYDSRSSIGRQSGPPQGNGGIAQLVEQLTLNQLVLGSSPSAPTNEFKHLGQSSGVGLFAFGVLVAVWLPFGGR